MEMQESTCTCGQLFCEPAPWSNANCFVVVTGASRGFGRAFCIQLVQQVADHRQDHCPPALSITFVLFGRDREALCRTENEIITSLPPQGSTNVTVYLACGDHLDMGRVDSATLTSSLQPLFDAMARCSKDGHPQWNLLVNNAASLGDVRLRADQHFSVTDLEAYFRVNLFSQILLTSVFLNHVAPEDSTASRHHHHPTTVLSVSSLAAVKPFSRMLTYCCGKAARDMHLKCLVVDRPSVAALNWSPGPLVTDMYFQLEQQHGDPQNRASYRERRQQGLVIEPGESARMCVRWLRRQRFCGQTGAVLFPARVCLVHQGEYRELWKGQHLDYFEARDLDEVEFNPNRL